MLLFGQIRIAMFELQSGFGSLNSKKQTNWNLCKKLATRSNPPMALGRKIISSQRKKILELSQLRNGCISLSAFNTFTLFNFADYIRHGPLMLYTGLPLHLCVCGRLITIFSLLMVARLTYIYIIIKFVCALSGNQLWRLFIALFFLFVLNQKVK